MRCQEMGTWSLLKTQAGWLQELMCAAAAAVRRLWHSSEDWMRNLLWAMNPIAPTLKRHTVSLKIKGRFENLTAPRIILLYTKSKVKNNYITLQQKKALRVFSKNLRFLTRRAAPKLHRPPNWYYITLQQMPGAPPIKLHTKPKIASAL